MSKKYIGYIRIDDEGAGAWASQKDESAAEAALEKAQKRCRERLLDTERVLKAAALAEQQAIEKNLRGFKPVFRYAASYGKMPSSYIGQPRCTFVTLKRTSARCWAVVAVFRDWLPCSEASARFFKLEKEDFFEWLRRVPAFLRVGAL